MCTDGVAILPRSTCLTDVRLEKLNCNWGESDRGEGERDVPGEGKKTSIIRGKDGAYTALQCIVMWRIQQLPFCAILVVLLAPILAVQLK
jgi:hypothetical protein